MASAKVIEPLTSIVFPALMTNVGVFATPVHVMLLMEVFNISTVIVLPVVKKELASNRTLSLADGKQPYCAPPELSDQCAGSDQLPVPPTQ